MPDTTPRDPMPPADRTGPHAQMWHCHPGRPGAQAIVADWIIETPAAHHLVHSCHVALMHLRPVHADDKVCIHVHGATHELWVMALDPAAPRAAIVRHTAAPVQHYYAKVFVAQIVAPTDEAAVARIAATIALILNGDLNPVNQDQWIELFGDAMLAPASGENANA